MQDEWVSNSRVAPCFSDSLLIAALCIITIMNCFALSLSCSFFVEFT